MDFQTGKNKLFPELINYQPSYATQRSTTKSCTGFYVKKGLKFKSRKYLEPLMYVQMISCAQGGST